jgi:hypothetical protein
VIEPTGISCDLRRRLKNPIHHILTRRIERGSLWALVLLRIMNEVKSLSKVIIIVEILGETIKKRAASQEPDDSDSRGAVRNMESRTARESERTGKSSGKRIEVAIKRDRKVTRILEVERILSLAISHKIRLTEWHLIALRVPRAVLTVPSSAPSGPDK